MSRVWFIVFVAASLLAGVVRAAGADARFSHAVTPEERAAIGLERLSSDQTAILDALVRRDVIAQAEADPASPPAAVFSERLSADERKNAGLAVLSDDQRRQLDTTVARLQGGGLSVRSLLTPPIFVSSSHAGAVRTSDKKQEREIHGSMSLSYGWGEGGYSTKSGSLIMNMTDPDKKYSVTIGYSETHVKGPNGASVYLGSGPRYPGDIDYLRP